MVENLQGSALAIILLSVSLSTFVVFLRLLSRYLGKNFGYDDVLIIIALIFSICHTGLTYAYVKLTYLGYHEKDIPLSAYTVPRELVVARANLARVIFYSITFGFARASAIVFLLRLEEYRQNIRRYLYILLVLNCMVMVAVTIVNIFACRPVHYLWDYPKMNQFVDGQWILGGTCINLLKFGMAVSIMTILLDALVLITPMAMVWKLRMSRTNKFIAVLVLSVGWLAIIASIGQLLIYIRIFQPSSLVDPTYNIGWTLANAETNIAIIAVSVPALKALFKRLNPRSNVLDSPIIHDSIANPSHYLSWDGPSGLDDIAGRRRPSRPTIDPGEDINVHFVAAYKTNTNSTTPLSGSLEGIDVANGREHDHFQRSTIGPDTLGSLTPSSSTKTKNVVL